MDEELSSDETETRRLSLGADCEIVLGEPGWQ